MTSLPRLLSVRELGEALGIPPWRLYRLAKGGYIPSVRVGRSLRFSAIAVRRWLDAGGTSSLGAA